MSVPQILVPGKFADGHQNLSVPERERKGEEGEGREERGDRMGREKDGDKGD